MLIGFLYLLHYALWIYLFIVIARAILSWVNPDPFNPVVRFLHQATDPVLYYVRRYVPLPRSTLDFSPIIVLVFITFCDSFILKTIRDLTMGVPVSFFSNLLYALVIGLHDIIRIYMLIIIIRAVVSWVNPDPYNPIVRFLYDMTEPVLYRVRRTLPLPMAGIDLSPLIVILVLFLVDSFLLNVLV